jgi:hypothetical protein
MQFAVQICSNGLDAIREIQARVSPRFWRGHLPERGETKIIVQVLLVDVENTYS